MVIEKKAIQMFRNIFKKYIEKYLFLAYEFATF